MRFLIGLLMILTLAGTARSEVRPGPWPPQGYACVRSPGKLVIDGRLDDSAWAAAPWTEAFVDIEGDRRGAPRLGTRAKMLWDDTYFYIAAALEEPHLWATLRQRDSIIYHDNDFEVFIDPDGDTHLYSELELNAFNTVWDLLLVKPYRNGGPALHAWDIPGLVTAVHCDGTVNDPRDEDTGWSVEIALPWAVLAETTDAACPPNPGDRWRVNFSRVQWRLEVIDGEYRKAVDPATERAFPEDNWVWSAQRKIAMHEPEHWGLVEFRTTDPVPAVTPTAADVAAWHLRLATYRLAAHRERHGTWPPNLPTADLPPGAPVLDPRWNWPPLFRPDGGRYTLELVDRHGDRGPVIHEDGRLVPAP